MKKQRIILFWAIVLSNILLLKYENISASVTYDGDGLGSTATGSGSGNCGTNGVQWTVGAGYGYLISLVKVSNGIDNPTAYPELKSYFYYLDSINESSFLNPDKNGNKYNFFGNRKVVGYMDGNNYSTGAIEVGAPEHKKNGFDNYTTKSSIVTKDSNTQQNIYNNSPYYLYGLGFKTSIMYTITGKKTKETLVNNPNETYMMLYMLYNRMSNEDKEKLGQAVNDKMNTFDPKMNDYNELSTIEQYFSDYRIIIEPIYRFNQCNGSQKVFATIKAVAAKNKTEANFFGGYWDFSNITDLFYSTSDHGPIKGINNCSGNSQVDKLADVNCGYGYLTITITDEVTECNPATTCCYNSDGAYQKNHSHSGKDNDPGFYDCVDSSGNSIGTKNTNCPKEKLKECVKPNQPEKCPDGTNATYLYYLFLAGVSASDSDTTHFAGFYDGDGDGIFDGKNEPTYWSDVELFKNLGVNDASQIEEKRTGQVKIDSADKIDWFYDHWKAASNSSNKYIEEITEDADGRPINNYYLWHSSTSEKYENDIKAYHNSLYHNFSIKADVTISKQARKNEIENSFSYAFKIRRKYSGLYTIDGNGSLQPMYNKQYLQPAAYQIAYCVSPVDKPADCQDNVKEAKCSQTDDHIAYFYENDNLKQCTLNENKNSGFTIISKETNKYCQVSCKDDIDISLPGDIENKIKAGTYFTLGEDIPRITGKRTCASTKIDSGQFQSDLLAAKDAMREAYAVWQANLKYYNYLNERKASNEYKNLSTSSEEYASENDTQEECSYTEITWDFGTKKSYTIVGKTISDFSLSGTYISSSTCDSINSVAENYTNSITTFGNGLSALKSKYEEAKSAYTKILGNFKQCLSWQTSDEFKYQFNPELDFQYTNLDAKYINHPMNKKEENASETEYYWYKNSVPDDSYGGGTTSNCSDCILEIVGEKFAADGTPTGSDTKIEYKNFYTYIKRIESKTYKYHLNELQTLIPSGAIVKDTAAIGLNKAALPLNAVPINVKTNEKNYQYEIIISNIADEVRTNPSKNKTINIDDYTTRFENRQLLAGNSTKYACEYEVYNDIFDPDPDPDPGNPNPNPGLLYFYRVIDLSNINPLGRTLGRNWTTAKSSLIEERMRETDSDYQKLHANEELNDESTTVRSDVDKFEFTLTPTLMRAIRSYDVNHKYEDFNLVCNNTNDENRYYCRSILLSCITSSGHISDTAAACDERILNAVQNYELDSPEYLYNDLRENRDRLINKNVALATH